MKTTYENTNNQLIYIVMKKFNNFMDVVANTCLAVGIIGSLLLTIVGCYLLAVGGC